MSHARVTVLPSPVVPISSPAWTIVVAGGSGSRFGTVKQYEMIGAQRMIDHAVATATRCTRGVVIAVPATDVARETESAPTALVVAGGSTRSASVRAGLAAV